jgi:hypothetical protein
MSFTFDSPSTTPALARDVLRRQPRALHRGWHSVGDDAVASRAARSVGGVDGSQSRPDELRSPHCQRGGSDWRLFSNSVVHARCEVRVRTRVAGPLRDRPADGVPLVPVSSRLVRDTGLPRHRGPAWAEGERAGSSPEDKLAVQGKNPFAEWSAIASSPLGTCVGLLRHERSKPKWCDASTAPSGIRQTRCDDDNSMAHGGDIALLPPVPPSIAVPRSNAS